MIKVQAIREGYYENSIRDIGVSFAIKSHKELGNWMEVLDKPALEASIEAEKIELEVAAKAAKVEEEAKAPIAPIAPIAPQAPLAADDLSHLL